MEEIIQVLPMSPEDVETELRAMSSQERFSFEEALACLSTENEVQAKSDILWLRGLGKEFLRPKPLKSEINGQLENIHKEVLSLMKSLSKAYPKTQFLLGKIEGLECLEKLAGAAEKALEENKLAPKNEYLGNGFSSQDEFIGFCLGRFNYHRPGIAKQNEDNDFHTFCKAMIGLVQGIEWEKSPMGSIRKALSA